MADVHLPPVVTDVRDCVYFAGHSEEFFKAMDDLKPYILLFVSNDSAVFKLYADEIDVMELRNKLERLNNLGYYADPPALYCWKFLGMTMLEMEALMISWNTSRAKCSRVEIPIHFLTDRPTV